MVTIRQPYNQIVRILPDLERCRAVNLADRFAKCLVEKSAACPYAMPFGYEFVCGHPDRDLIVANTQSLQEQDRSS